MILRRTENDRAGARDFAANRLHLTAPTGDTAAAIDALHPELRHARRRQVTDLVWALEFPEEQRATMDVLASRLAGAAGRLERAACGTLNMLDWSFASAPRFSRHRPDAVSVSYAPFWPNGLLAAEIGVILAECSGQPSVARPINYEEYLRRGCRPGEVLLTILVPPWPGWRAVLADLGSKPEVASMLGRLVGATPPADADLLAGSMGAGRILLGRFHATWYQSGLTHLNVDELGLATVGGCVPPSILRHADEEY